MGFFGPDTGIGAGAQALRLIDTTDQVVLTMPSNNSSLCYATTANILSNTTARVGSCTAESFPVTRWVCDLVLHRSTSTQFQHSGNRLAHLNVPLVAHVT